MEGLWEQLVAYSKEDVVGLHMPGHKRNTAMAPYLAGLGAALDITELPGFDDLHAPSGVIKEAQGRLARLYGSEDAFFSVNGSTGALLAAIRTVCRRGDRVLLGRNCHKSIHHAIALCGLEPRYLQGAGIPGFGCHGGLTAQAVYQALVAHAPKLLILTSPSYEGLCLDVAAMVRGAHERGVPVLVDEAHGAHLGLGGGFPHGAVKAGADLVVQSAHKTLPSLTQTAFLHRQGQRVDQEALCEQMGVFQTSSPSYLLLSSLDGCVRLLANEGAILLKAWHDRLVWLRERLRPLKHLVLLGTEQTGGLSLDPSKIVIGSGGMTGVALSALLRERYGIQVEMASASYVIAMTGMGDGDEALERFATALLAVDETLCGHDLSPLWDTPLPALPTMHLLPWQATEMAWRRIPLMEAQGQIAAASLWAYPPGAPILIPGEEIDTACLSYLHKMQQAGVNLLSSRGTLSQGMPVVAF